MKKLLAIINPISGTRGKADIPEMVKNVLDSSKYDVEVVFTQYAGHGKELAAKAASQGAYGVIAVGGDGTVNEIGSALRDTETAMAVVPIGSGNGLARHLEIPLDVKRSLELVNLGNVRSHYYCTVNDIPFFCTCGMGFDAQVAYSFAHAGSRGFITYIKLTLKEYFSYVPQRYRIDADGVGADARAFVIACANASQYGNDAFIAPQASMHDGLIDCVVINPFGLLKVPVLAARLFTRSIHRDSAVHTLRARRLVIEREQEAPIHIDGEPLQMPKRLEVECHHNGIKIFVPVFN